MDSGIGDGESPTYEARPASQTARGGGFGAPEHMGPYHILGVLGEGGMGIVYLAEQHEPIARRVALKLVTPGMDSREVLRRFEAERLELFPPVCAAIQHAHQKGVIHRDLKPRTSSSRCRTASPCRR